MLCFGTRIFGPKENSAAFAAPFRETRAGWQFSPSLTLMTLTFRRTSPVLVPLPRSEDITVSLWSLRFWIVIATGTVMALLPVTDFGAVILVTARSCVPSEKQAMCVPQLFVLADVAYSLAAQKVSFESGS